MLMQRCRLSLVLAGLLLLSGVTSVLAAERDAVLRVEGCTGFIVEGNLLVTAKHCRHPATLTVTVQGQAVAARRVYAPDGEDGPVVFRLDGGPHPSLPVAQRKPEPGERVYSLGYPGGNWARIEGELIGGNGVDVNYTNHRIATGNSGGPLLNERGEVIGVALFVAADVTVHRSGFTGWQTTIDAIRTAQRPASEKPQRYSRRPIVVVFSSESCGPCKQLERDVRAGHFEDYEFRFIKWDDARDQWSDPAVYDEFLTRCRPDTKSLGFPTIWVQGTDQYRVGYTTERRGGLLGWLAAAVRHLIQGLIGRDPEPQFPVPETPRVPDVSNVPKVEPTPRSDELLLRLAQDLAALRDEAVKTKSDLEEFKESGVVGKIRTLARLKSDKDDALERVASVKADVAELRSQFREHPLQFLWGLFGLVSGLIHRRFAA